MLADLIAMAGAAHLEPVEQGARDWLLADVAARLRAEGLAVGVRFGVGGDVIPLVVGEGSAFTVAVVTDDALPAQGTSLRDQVRWQRARLESLGWVVVPLWTLDAFIDPAAATDAILRVVGRKVGDEPRASAPLVSGDEASRPEDEPPSPLPERTQDPFPDSAADPLLPRRSVDDSDVGWGGSESAPSRDEELRREVPPHW
jgi:hypothetical protein